MNTLAIDDEIMALRVIENYISKIPFLKHKHSYTNALLAIDYLNANQIDLLFLDINMPDISGLQLLKSLRNPPMVIFTTAYSSFAVESYEYEAIDYLLKPIEFDRFLIAVNKAQAKLSPSNSKSSATSESILVKSGTSLVQINLQEILYIEGTGNYITFVLPKEKILSLMTMSEILSLLPSDRFSRTHKSFIVANDKVRSIDKNEVKIASHEVPMSATYREEFIKKIKSGI